MLSRATGGPPLPGRDGARDPEARRAHQHQRTAATSPACGATTRPAPRSSSGSSSCPGFGKPKARILLALLGKQLGVTPAGWREAAASVRRGGRPPVARRCGGPGQPRGGAGGEDGAQAGEEGRRQWQRRVGEAGSSARSLGGGPGRRTKTADPATTLAPTRRARHRRERGPRSPDRSLGLNRRTRVCGTDLARSRLMGLRAARSCRAPATHAVRPPRDLTRKDWQ